MTQFVYDNLVAIMIGLSSLTGVGFAAAYHFKRSVERSKENAERLNAAHTAITELVKLQALSEQRQSNHENICLDHKERLEKHLEKIYDKLDARFAGL